MTGMNQITYDWYTMKILFSNEEIVRDRETTPVWPAYSTPHKENGQTYVWCKYCLRWHRHGWQPVGETHHKTAHCMPHGMFTTGTNVEPPTNHRGYYVQSVGYWDKTLDAQPRLGLPKLYLRRVESRDPVVKLLLPHIYEPTELGLLAQCILTTRAWPFGTDKRDRLLRKLRDADELWLVQLAEVALPANKWGSLSAALYKL